MRNEDINMNGQYKDFAIAIARDAGVIMQKYFSGETKTEWKKDNTPLTVADTTINKMVIDCVAKTFPSHGVIGEEQSNFLGSEDYVWVCDPIDGTIPYTYGIPMSTFSLALVECKTGHPIVGVVYDPFLDKLFFAEKGYGAFMNNQKIHVAHETNVGRRAVTMEWWRDAPYSMPNLFQELSNKNYIVLVPSSLVYGAMLVASGETVASIFCGNGAHDVAAAKVIVEEAGGRVTDIYGNNQRYNQKIRGAIISNGTAHDEFILHVKKCLV